MRARWDSSYPDPVQLRKETEAMARACTDALLQVIPREEIASITLKGSAIKRWDTPVDYVPELSDIDVHILFARGDAAQRLLDPVDQGLRIQARTEQLFTQAVPAPTHLPRVQLVVFNDLRSEPDYIPSPPGTEIVVIGREEPKSPPDPATARERSRRKLLEAAPFLATLGQHIADKPGKHLWQVARAMSWRVSPAGPRVLELRGVPYNQAWTLNRTAILNRLQDFGADDLAREYSAFYLSAWECFLSRFQSDDALRSVVLAGTRVLERSVAIAQTRESSS